MFSYFSKLFDVQGRTVARYTQIVEAITALEPEMQALSDVQLRGKTQEFKDRIQAGEVLEVILPEAFAVVREASRRTTGLRHFDVQLMAGLAFHEGKVAEQKTGEGKTLSATTALYLNALEGKGAHLVTVNDYLAQIGAGWMGPLYSLLGLSVAVIGHEVSVLYDPDFTGEKRGDERLEHFRPITRQQAYAADITYGTNNEFGFDYLRDNMAQRLRDRVQRGHNFAIVDEADSILIDEARTPLIISAPDSEPTDKYVQFAELVKKLQPATDYEIDEKMKTAVLTETGIHHLEEMLKVKNLYEESFTTIHHVEQALKAQSVFKRDVDYVNKAGEIVIVDEHTGRLMYGRRYSDGLHQAIEAKEAVQVQQESRTLATVSLQNYFRMYAKLSGMSGTATTEAEEFLKIYNMDVFVVPTNRSVQRTDFPDIVYKTATGKYRAILQEIQTIHETGRPILIGTKSIEQNQLISELMDEAKIKHQVLNAKNHEKEAFIIAEAGKKNAITVATNIAGRGVDIVLGGAQPERRDFESESAFEKAQREWQKAHDEVVALGGLHVLGSVRHESRRIDNQLRGRAGRQGDPGSSRFYVSLEDELMRIFGGDQLTRVMNALRVDENMPIESPLITRAITQAQIKVEGFFFDQRKSLVDYDDVMNRQREVIYARRTRLLESMQRAQDDETSRELKERLLNSFRDYMAGFIAARQTNGWTDTEIQNVTTELASLIPFDSQSLRRIKEQLLSQKSAEDMKTFLQSVWLDTYQARETNVGNQVMREIELYVYLSVLDEHWMNHLDDMTSLRDSIWLRGAKEQALAEYKKEAFTLFSNMVQRIELEALKRVFRIQVAPKVQPRTDVLEINTTQNAASVGEALLADNPTPMAAGASTAEGQQSRRSKKLKKRAKGAYLRKK